MWDSSRRVAFAFALLALLAGGAGCGDDDGETISKEEYVERANEACEEAIAAHGEEAVELSSPPTEEELNELADQIVDVNREIIDVFRELPVPEGDDAEIESIIERSIEATDRFEADPLSFVESGENPYEDVNEDIDEYGMTSCTS
jgi:hypothetical protein